MNGPYAKLVKFVCVVVLPSEPILQGIVPIEMCIGYVLWYFIGIGSRTRLH